MNPLSLRTSIMCFGLIALVGCGKNDQQPQQPPPPDVSVLQVQPQSAPLVQNLVGRLSPFRSADVRARVPGVLMRRVYEEGTDVKKGDVLFKIDPAPLRADLNAAMANLSQAQATAANNKIAADRARALVPQGYVAKSDVDNAEAAERTAAAAVKQNQANVQSARINLGYTDVTSPIDGRAGQQQVTEGALVGQGDTTLLTTVDQIDPLYVNFTMSVTDLDQMRRSAAQGATTLADQNKTTVSINLPDGTPYDQEGTLDFSSATVNPQTGSVSLRARLPNPSEALLPGMYVTLKANLGQFNNVFLVPQAAVLRDAASAYVLVAGADNKAVRKDVQADNMRGSDFIVTAGLAANDRVIIGGLPKAKPGQPVKPSPYDPTKEKAAAAPGAAQAGYQAPSAQKPAEAQQKTGDKPAKQ
jgi:membrane fusion protein (multidrug efflux system)